MTSPSEPVSVYKRMHYYMAADLSGSRLRQMGWYDVRDLSHQTGADVVEVACDCFIELATGKDGEYNQSGDIIGPILRFVEDETGCHLDDHERDLLKILRTRPFDADAVRAWFDTVFRCK